MEDLASKGYTYEIAGEGIYFDTAKLKEYGKLAKLDIAGLQEGARVQVDGKKNATDFAPMEIFAVQRHSRHGMGQSVGYWVPWVAS